MEKLEGYPKPAIVKPSAPNEGERYIGVILRADGSGHHLYRLPLQKGLKKSWPEAVAYATEQGAELPDRVESALLLATREDGEFEGKWYWTSEQYASQGAFAWCQHFGDGGQAAHGKGRKLPIVLVRRLPI